jgi:hypothetical protein
MILPQRKKNEKKKKKTQKKDVGVIYHPWIIKMPFLGLS